ENFGDCNVDVADGCEKSLLTLDTCGSCDAPVCEFESAEANCSTGTCERGACALGTADCNGSDEDGCEADVTMIGACGACGTACSVPSGVPCCATNEACVP